MKKSTRIPVYLGAVILLQEWIYGLYVQAMGHINSDVSLHIQTVGRMLEGQKLYQDIIAVNLPICFYLRMPGVLLAQVMGWNPLTVAGYFDDITAVLTLALALWVLRKLPFAASSAAWGLCLAVLGFTHFVLPSFDNMIGEKEYYFWLLTLPYFLMMAAKEEGIPFSFSLRVLLSIVAAIGFSYKPTCLLPFILVEGFLCLRARSLKPLFTIECAVLGLLGAAYCAWMLVAFKAYFTNVVPLLRFYLASSPAGNPVDLFMALHIAPVVLPCVLLAVCLAVIKPPLRRFYIIIFLASAGYLLDGAVQMKPYMHHFYPTFAMAILLFTIACANFWNAHPPLPATVVRILLAGTLAGLFPQIYWLTYNTQPDYKPMALKHAVLLAEASAHAHRPPVVYTMGFAIAPFFPFGVMQGLRWDYHFSELWIVNGIRNFKEAHIDKGPDWIKTQTEPAEQYMMTTVASDIDRVKPDYILADWVSNFDWFEYFRQNPAMAHALSHYKFVESFGEMNVYVRDTSK